MAMSIKTMATTAMIATVIAGLSTPAQACCYFRGDGYFLRVHAAPYATSALHTVVTPDFAVRNLALLFRTASGVPITPLELSALERSWARSYDDVDGRVEAEAAQLLWEKAASRVLGMQPSGRGEVFGGTAYYQRINPDAFRRAQHRLKVRQQRYAEYPELLKAWTAWQSRILSVDFDAPTTLPATVPPKLAADVAADVALLSALEAFYDGRHEDAVTAFDAITTGDDAAWAGINAARARLRQATLDATTPEQRAAYFADAERRLRAITAKDERIAGAVQSLLLLALRERGGLCEAIPDLMRRTRGDALPNLLEAFEAAVPPVNNEGYIGERAPGFTIACDALPALQQWVSVFRQLVVPGWNSEAVASWSPEHRRLLAGAAQAKKQALAQWTKTPTKPWLLAALTAADGTEPELPALLAAARAIDPAEVVGPTVAVHEVRLLRLSGKRAEARARLAELPTSKWSTSAQNFFDSERVLLAETAVDALAFIWPKKAATNYNVVIDSHHIDETLSWRVGSSGLDGATMLSLSSTTTLPVPLRQSLAWSAFVRAALFGGNVKAAAQAVLALDERATDLVAVRDTVDDPTARGLALRAAMEHPGASANLLFVNDRAVGAIAAAEHYRYGCESTRNGWNPTEGSVPTPPWATSSAAIEDSAIAPGSSIAYARAAIAFAKANPTHALSPELLHLAVHHSRYTSGGADTKAAFTLLHQQWSSSTWTRKTPIYW
jgi:hypothetical protein